jgi:hypothetical protein
MSCLVADSLRGAPSHLVDPATGPAGGGQNWGNSVIESGEIPLILVSSITPLTPGVHWGRQTSPPRDVSIGLSTQEC